VTVNYISSFDTGRVLAQEQHGVFIPSRGEEQITPRCAKRRSHCDPTFGNGMPSAHDAGGRQPEVRIHLPPADSLSLSRSRFRRSRTRLSARVWAAGLPTVRGRAELLRPKGRESYDAAIGLFQRALAFDPGSVEAQSRLAMVLANRLMIFGSDAADSDSQEVEALTLRALGTAHDEFQIAFQGGEVGSYLIGLPQR
jgi:hypothetical protein